MKRKVIILTLSITIRRELIRANPLGIMRLGCMMRMGLEEFVEGVRIGDNSAC